MENNLQGEGMNQVRMRGKMLCLEVEVELMKV